ncbi:MAG: hypothetical protein QOH31_4496 [Verrucomicrobiota bacterium]
MAKRENRQEALSHPLSLLPKPLPFCRRHRGAIEPDRPNRACRPQYEWLSRDQIWYTGDSMNEWLHSLPVWQMALVVFAITYLATGGILVIIMALAKGEWSRLQTSVLRPAVSVGNYFRPDGRI